MGVTATNLLGGAGELYHGAFGAVEPVDTAVGADLAPEVWTDFGGTDGGVNHNVDRNFYDLRADQIMDPAGTRQTSRLTTIWPINCSTSAASAIRIHGWISPPAENGSLGWTSCDTTIGRTSSASTSGASSLFSRRTNAAASP